MNTVFVVQSPDGKEIASAKEYGDLEVILSGKEDPQVALRRLHKHLRFFQPNDFLLLLGSPLNMAMAFNLACLFAGGKVNVLVWEREKYKYSIEHIAINEYFNTSVFESANGSAIGQ